MPTTTAERDEIQLHEIPHAPVRVVRDLGLGLIEGAEDLMVTAIRAIGDVAGTTVEETANVGTRIAGVIGSVMGSAMSSGSDLMAGRRRGTTGTGTGTTTSSSSHSGSSSH